MEKLVHLEMQSPLQLITISFLWGFFKLPGYDVDVY